MFKNIMGVFNLTWIFFIIGYLVVSFCQWDLEPHRMWDGTYIHLRIALFICFIGAIMAAASVWDE